MEMSERVDKLAAILGGKAGKGIPYGGGTAHQIVLGAGKYMGPPMYVIEKNGELTLEQKASLIRTP